MSFLEMELHQSKEEAEELRIQLNFLESVTFGASGSQNTPQVNTAASQGVDGGETNPSTVFEQSAADALRKQLENERKRNAELQDQLRHEQMTSPATSEGIASLGDVTKSAVSQGIESATTRNDGAATHSKEEMPSGVVRGLQEVRGQMAALVPSDDTLPGGTAPQSRLRGASAPPRAPQTRSVAHTGNDASSSRKPRSQASRPSGPPTVLYTHPEENVSGDDDSQRTKTVPITSEANQADGGIPSTASERTTFSVGETNGMSTAMQRARNGSSAEILMQLSSVRQEMNKISDQSYRSSPDPSPTAHQPQAGARSDAPPRFVAGGGDGGGRRDREQSPKTTASTDHLLNVIDGILGAM